MGVLGGVFVLKSGLRILIQAPEVPFLVAPKSQKHPFAELQKRADLADQSVLIFSGLVLIFEQCMRTTVSLLVASVIVAPVLVAPLLVAPLQVAPVPK